MSTEHMLEKSVSASIKSLKSLNQRGVTLIELIITMAISSIVLISVFSISIYLYGDSIRATMQARLGGESQNILRSITEELRQSSSIRANNANPDSYAPSGGWSTSNSNLILIISTPALDSSNNFIINPQTGFPYQNEIVYFTNGTQLYKRHIAALNATGNARQSTCPQISSNSSCPPDILMSSNFKTLGFTFYNQDDVVTTDIPTARSILLNIELEKKIYGKAAHFNNSIRITIRNNV